MIISVFVLPAFFLVLLILELFPCSLLKLAPKALTTLFEKVPDGVLVLDKHLLIVDMNPAARQILSLNNDSIGKPVGEVLGSWPELIRLLEKALQCQRIELRRNTPEPCCWLELTFLPLQEDGGQLQGQIIIMRDITARKLAERKLQQNEERYRLLLENANEAIMVIQDGQLKFFNPMTMKLLGYTEEFVQSIPFLEFIHSKDRPFMAKKLAKVLDEKSELETNAFKIITKSGKIKWVEASGVFIEWERQPAALVFANDITQRKLNEEKLEYLSMHDPLTGLYNRAFFEEEMKRLSGSREYPITIISADVDGLKLINDTMGHAKGDQLLQACAGVLRKSLRSSDILARVGGDEFAALLPRTDEKAGKEIVKRIGSYSEIHNQKHNDLPLSISVGAATAGNAEVPLHEVYINADYLMYSNKLRNKNKVRSYTIDMLLNALAERDFIAGGHAQRLSRMCLTIAEKLELPKTQLINLAMLAQVHDLGKIGVPDSILFKEGTLTEEEWEIMRQHPEKGYRLALTSPDLAEFADLILKHHENWDGSGYPLGIKGKEIPIECRIFALVDAFDSMTTDRPYRKAISEKEALKELKKYSGTRFDPEIVNLFLSIMQEQDR
ncbi:MAG: diguanylate cyclase [Firmicutes bacterium]|nr:diguanylate cyclase [Bacillota bacterium]